MPSNSKIVCGGGWVKCQRFGRPKLRLFTLLAAAWSFVSAVPVHTIYAEATGSGMTGLTLLCAAFILPQPVFILLAIYFWQTEKPHQWTETIENPDCDPKCLY